MLISLVLPPLAGSGFLARREALERSADARAASHVEALTAAFVAIADLRSAMTNEQMFASAWAIVNNPTLKVEPAIIEAVLGGNLQSRLAEMAAEVDRAYATAQAVLLAPSLAGNGPLEAVEAARIVEAHDGTRAISDGLRVGTVSFDDVSRVYGGYGASIRLAVDEMAGVLASAAAKLEGTEQLSRQVTAIRRQVTLSAIMSNEIVSAASLVLGALLDVSVSASASDLNSLRAEIVKNTAKREVAAAELEEMLDLGLIDAWRRARNDPQSVTFERALVVLGTGGEVKNVDIASVASDGLVRLEMHNDLLPMLLDDVAESASGAFSRAAQRRDETLRLLAVLLLGTFVLVTAAVVVVSRPLGRLHGRARAVRDGTLDSATRVTSAIAELYDTQLVFDEIVANLRAIELQATAIVEGRLTEPDAGLKPGPLGRSVQESLARLAEVTRQLQTSEALSNAIVETAAEAIWSIDETGRVQRANAASEQITSIPSAEANGRHFLDFIDELDRPYVDSLLVSGDLDSVEVRMLRPLNESVPVLLSSSVVVLGNDRYTTVIGRDITERKDFELQLELHAATDSLTGLPNRRSAVAQISESLTSAKQGFAGVGVVFCDLDGFKQANDLYGHAFGDDVLREVARRFRQITRGSETLARLGGDEFIVVVRHCENIETPTRLANRLLESLQELVVVGDRRVRINGSFGVAWNGGDASVSDLLREADVAMFTAKAGGGGQVRLFDNELQQALLARVDIETGLHHALANDEFHFVYQPIVSSGTHEVVGVEALVRWERPDRGTVSPASFIPIAEQSDLVIDIGRWGLRAAARQLLEWEDLIGDRPFSVSVNVAGVHLSRYDIVADVQAVLAEFPVDPSRFRIEITETQLVDDLDVAAESMRRLAALGVSVAIDDYGTGFSSIAYLRQLPLSAIKIDRSFIVQLSNERDLAMVESLVTLANLLNLDVVAEGVETETQLSLAERIGCDLVQGYLIARPMLATDFETWLRNADAKARALDGEQTKS